MGQNEIDKHNQNKIDEHNTRVSAACSFVLQGFQGQTEVAAIGVMVALHIPKDGLIILETALTPGFELHRSGDGEFFALNVGPGPACCTYEVYGYLLTPLGREAQRWLSGGRTESFDGLGITNEIAPGGATQVLHDTINRSMWIDAIRVEPANAEVTSITIAGMPVNIGSLSAPGGVYPIQRGIHVGQPIRVGVANPGKEPMRVQAVAMGAEVNWERALAIWEEDCAACQTVGEGPWYFQSLGTGVRNRKESGAASGFAELTTKGEVAIIPAHLILVSDRGDLLDERVEVWLVRGSGRIPVSWEYVNPDKSWREGGAAKLLDVPSILPTDYWLVRVPVPDDVMVSGSFNGYCPTTLVRPM